MIREEVGVFYSIESEDLFFLFVCFLHCILYYCGKAREAAACNASVPYG